MAAKSVFLVAGDEGFLKEEWLERTRQGFLKRAKGSTIDFNQFYAYETDLSHVLDMARTKTFLSDKRLIILKGIDRLSASHHKDQLLRYVQSPSQDTVLVLEATIREKDFLKDRFFAKLSKSAKVLFFKRLYGRNLLTWIAERFRMRKKRAGSQVPELLEQLKGNNLQAIDQDIEKLSLYTARREVVTTEDVQALIGRDTRGRLDDIFNAISRSDRKRALAASLHFQKKELSGITGLLCWNLRRYLRVKEYVKKGLGDQEIENKMGFRGFQTVAVARRLTIPWIKTALSEVTELDRKVKRGASRNIDLDWQMLMVRLVASL